MKKISFNKLNQKQQEIARAAFEAAKTAYNPYSNFYVGAALENNAGEYITGSNVENAAYGSTICAERSAIVRANAQGMRHFNRIAIVGGTMNQENKITGAEIVSPCGSCLQVIFEFWAIRRKSLEIILLNGDMNKAIVTTIKELLPLGFGPKNLGSKK